jgi:hypothetical protein
MWGMATGEKNGRKEVDGQKLGKHVLASFSACSVMVGFAAFRAPFNYIFF